jgi:hypothetical protein
MRAVKRVPAPGKVASYGVALIVAVQHAQKEMGVDRVAHPLISVSDKNT